MLARHLLARGCRRLICVGNAPNDLPWRRSREEGVASALTEAGAAPAPSIVFARGTAVRRPATAAEFDDKARLVAGYLSEHLTGAAPVDAILAQNDIDGFLVARACRWFGREPGKDIFITGYDNMWEMAQEREWEPWIPTATVDKDNRACGEMLGKLMLDRLAGTLPPEPQCLVMAPRLVVLESAN
jgi:DNA-binding LacI/PurR family transcriptional regulator